MALRAFRLPADFETLEAIIPLTFQYPENEEWGIGLDEMENFNDSIKTFRRIWPLFRVAMLISPPLRDAMLGFVWEEEGQVVGLTNVARFGRSARWEIGNVSVLPEFRRRGIARQLVEACVDLAHSRGAKQIELDVIDGNVPAYNLYLSLGFEHFSGSVNLYCEHPTHTEQPPLPDGYTIERSTPFNWEPRYRLVKRITPEEVQKYSPVSEDVYRPPAVLRPLIWLVNMLSGTKEELFLIRPTGEEEIVAYIRYGARRKKGGENTMTLRIDPAHPALTPPLLAMMMARIEAISPDHPIEITVPRWQPLVKEAAEQAGFTTRRPFHTLGLLLEQGTA